MTTIEKHFPYIICQFSFVIDRGLPPGRCEMPDDKMTNGKWKMENVYDIRTVQELLGHKDVSTTMIYTHVLNRGGRGVRSPLDNH